MTMNGRVSETTRKAILDCYAAMKDYLHSDEVRTDKRYFEMEHAISKLKIAIPQPLMDKIEAFIQEELEPIICLPDIVFSAHHIKGVVYDEDSMTFYPTTEQSAHELDINYRRALFDIDSRLEEFGETVLRPYLLTA